MNQQCKVCGEAAAGFHFGAFTCEGCKSFFGRTYNNLSSISECKNGGQCIINKKNRTSCKACRLRKCLVVGMSKSGSRYGRRSNWFKIHCLLQEQSNNNNNNNNNAYQNALQSFIPPNKMPRMDLPKKQGSLDELRSTPESNTSSNIDDETHFLRTESTPSPFSEKDFLLQRSLSPATGNSLLLQQRLYYASAFAAIKPGKFEHLFGGREILNFPALAGVAEDQNEPIDLSVKSKSEPKTADDKIKLPLDLTKAELV